MYLYDLTSRVYLFSLEKSKKHGQTLTKKSSLCQNNSIKQKNKLKLN